MKKLLFCSLTVLFLILLFCTIMFGKIIYDNKYELCTHPKFEAVTQEPTCTAEGRIKHRCADCGYEYTSQITPPLSHSFSSAVTQPTCTEQGYTLFYCKCGYSYSGEFLPPTSHLLSCQSFLPDCTEQGYKQYTCSKCSYSFKSDFTAPTGHSYTENTVRPTATSAGYTEYSCDCSYSYRGSYVYYSDILESAYTENTNVLARGCDVSRWNHQINIADNEYLPLDFNAIRAAGFDFVIIKAGSTKTGVEPTFESDYLGAKAAGLQVGAYFYTYSTTVEGILQDAELLISTLKGKQLEYPIYLDLEDPTLEGVGKNHLSNMCVAFLERLQQEGYYAGLYTNHNWLTNILDTAKMVTLFDIWYARYPGSGKPTWNEELYGKQLGMWQYTQSGSISGLEGEFDFNYCYKDYPSIMKKWELNGY